MDRINKKAIETIEMIRLEERELYPNNKIIENLNLRLLSLRLKEEWGKK